MLEIHQILSFTPLLQRYRVMRASQLLNTFHFLLVIFSLQASPPIAAKGKTFYHLSSQLALCPHLRFQLLFAIAGEVRTKRNPTKALRRDGGCEER